MGDRDLNVVGIGIPIGIGIGFSIAACKSWS